ncbi:MAG: hypothetical protein HY719_05335 [Planctomycetes bacterium]|nr:hypothetical protein [Planctomycetota bacterium]
MLTVPSCLPGAATVSWNWKRKVWHASGCALILLVFFLWRRPDTRLPAALISGYAALWMTLIDIVRLRSERNNAAFRRWFGGWLRDTEIQGYNASSYYLWGTFFLAISASDVVLVSAIVILGVADPAAAVARRLLERGAPPRAGASGSGEGRAPPAAAGRWARLARPAGLLVFTLVGAAAIAGVSRLMEEPLVWGRILFIALVVALVESFTKNVVDALRPVTRAVQRRLDNALTRWFWRFYPDDNLTILLATAFASAVVRFGAR